MQLDFTNKPKARIALAIATEHHRGITRKFDGKPYIEHPIEVAEILLRNGVTDQHMLAAALLHDCCEDENAQGHRMPISEVDRKLGVRVARMVGYLTREKGMSKARYLERLAEACHDTKTIKAADMISNMRRLHETPDDFRERQLAKRHEGLQALHSNAWGDTYRVGYAAKDLLEKQQLAFLKDMSKREEEFREEQRLDALEVENLAREIITAEVGFGFA